MLFASSALLTLAGLAVCDAHAQPAAHAVFEDSSPRAFELLQPAPAAGSVLARGFAVGPFPGEPEQAARAFLQAHGPQLGLPAVDLEPLRSTTWRDRAHVRLQQRHGGVPVAGAVAVVTLDADQRAVMVSAQLHDDLTVDPTPGISRDAALASALEAMTLDVVDPALVGLWVLPDARGGRLVWRVELWPEQPGAHWRATVDAHSGALITLRDMRQHALADVWEHNAANSELIEVELHGLVEGDTTLTSDLAEVHTLVYDGSASSEQQTALADDNGDFFYEPDDEEAIYDDPFAEVNAYHHVTDIRTWFAEDHGHSWGGPVELLVNYRDSASGRYDNAYFSKDLGGNYTIVLGQGTIDLAYDADVIQHEFGHGIVDDLCDINSELDYPISFDEYGLHSAPHAVNEGMADYWSSTFQGDPCSAEYFGSAFGSDCLRDLDNDNSTPDDLLGEAHEDGMIIGGALWAVREVIGIPEADDIIYGALGSLTPAPTFLEYATAVDEHAAAAGLDQSTLDAVAAIFEERGWYKSGRAIDIPDGGMEQGLFLGADLLAGYAGSSACTLARSFDGGLLFPLPFQFSFTVPTDVEVTAVNIDFGLDKASIPNVLDDDDLQYAFYVRQGQMITFEEYNLYELIGFDFTILTDVLDYDLTIDDQPESVRLEVSDPDYPLVPGETYYFDLVGMNCPIMTFAIAVDFEIAEPIEDEPGKCGCASGRAAGSTLGLLGLLGLAGLVRRRR
jgi:MYXO-CTERM domain-containing protein